MMNSNPKISVIMSVYNEEKYIRESLGSLQNQTESNFEVIIIDDCSTDSTRDIIGEIIKADNRFKLYENTENRGLTKNLNYALTLTKGTYIARMDGDDLSEPKRFETQLRYLETHPQVKLVSCNTKTFGAINLVSDINGNPANVKCSMLLRPQLAHPGFMMRAELVRDLGFTYDEHFRSAQDYDFAWRVSRKYDIAVTPEYLLRYRTHSAQVSSVSGGKQLAFADEIRQRGLAELGIELGSGITDEQYASYRLWAQEADAKYSDFVFCKNLIGIIIQKNGDVHIYDTATLEKTLWLEFFRWVFRSNGKKYALKLCGADAKSGVDIKLLGTMCGTWCNLAISKVRRKFMA